MILQMYLACKLVINIGLLRTLQNRGMMWEAPTPKPTNVSIYIHTHMYSLLIYLAIYLSASLFIYRCIYIYICKCMYKCILVYVYIHIDRHTYTNTKINSTNTAAARVCSRRQAGRPQLFQRAPAAAVWRYEVQGNPGQTMLTLLTKLWYIRILRNRISYSRLWYGIVW